MTSTQSFMLALLAAVAVTACTGGPQTSSSPAPAASPAAGVGPAEPDAAALFRTYKTSGDFEKVNTAPVKSGPHVGDVDIYVDKAHARQYKTVGAQAPDGMTVVKASVQEPQRAYIMKKIKGYDPANSDWYYANTKADGAIEMTGKPQMCIGCHGSFKATDYLAAPASENAKALLQ